MSNSKSLGLPENEKGFDSFFWWGLKLTFSSLFSSYESNACLLRKLKKNRRRKKKKSHTFITRKKQRVSVVPVDPLMGKRHERMST